MRSLKGWERTPHIEPKRPDYLEDVSEVRHKIFQICIVGFGIWFILSLLQ